jgi:16S rRNA (guanine966-N2)-methyltransferase
MRVISGKWRGRRLVSFKAEHVRPTTDRVKESLFNKLQAEWEGARVLDLYAGTGNIGIEALSRGASKVVAGKSIEIIRRNIAEFGIGPEYSLIKDDVVKYLQRYRGEAFHVVIADPPFTLNLAHATLEALSESAVMGPESIAVVEASSHERVDESYMNLSCVDRRDYGDKLISFWMRKPITEEV